MTKSFSADLRLWLAVHSEARRYQTGDILFREGDPADGVYLLQSGRLRVYSENEQGREITYNTMEAGEFFGEMMLDGGPRSASVRALTDAECRFIKGKDFLTAINRYPELAVALLLKSFYRMRRASHAAHSLALESVHDRVAALLEAHAIPEGKIKRVPSDLFQSEIAVRIGATRERVNQVIGKMVRTGVLHKDSKQRMTILKPLK